VSLSCFASAVFRFCNRTAAARVGAGRRSPGVVRLDPPRIAAAVEVRAGGPGYRIQLGRWCGGGPSFRDLLRRRGQGVTSGETRVKKDHREVQCRFKGSVMCGLRLGCKLG
jgi:hypothetical protein